MEEIFNKLYKDNEWITDKKDKNPEFHTIGSTKETSKQFIDTIKPEYDEDSFFIDLGCGDGYIGYSICSENNPLYYGFDCSSVIVNIAKNKYPNLKFFQSELSNFDWTEKIETDNEKDYYINIKDVIQHWDNYSIIVFLEKLIKVCYMKFKGKTNNVFIYLTNTIPKYLIDMIICPKDGVENGINKKERVCYNGGFEGLIHNEYPLKKFDFIPLKQYGFNYILDGKNILDIKEILLYKI